jgi:DNA-binding transcriptional LysR family regulator
MNRTTLEQWRMLQAVVEHGGFAQAAEAIHKSQSTINHAVHKLQSQLGLPLLEVIGRKAQLTEAGALMLRRAGQLLEQAKQLEAVASSLAEGTEAEVRIAADAVYPDECLANALQALSESYPNTRVQLPVARNGVIRRTGTTDRRRGRPADRRACARRLPGRCPTGD